MSDAPVPIDRLLAHRPWVRALAHALAAPSDADDLEQEVWLAAIDRPPRHDGSLCAWLASVLRRQLAFRRRGAARRSVREHAAARPEGSSPDEDLVAEAEIHARVAQAVAALREPERTTVLLRFFEGLPPREVAARMNVPVETVRSRLRRALADVRAGLGPGDDRRALAVVLAPLLSAHPGATATAVAGGVVAALWTKVAAVAAAVVCVAAGAWWLSDSSPPDVAGSGGAPQAPSGAPAEPGSPRAARPGVSSPPTGNVEAAPATRPAAKRVPVRVVAVDGSPVAGARVVADDGRGHAWTATTDARGEAVFDAPEGPYLYVRATGSGVLVTGWTRVDPALGWGRPDLVLAGGAALAGTVMDARSGAPVAGALVVITQGGEVTETWTQRDGPPLATVAADSAGNFGPVNVPRGVVVTATARAPGYATTELCVHMPVAGDAPRAEIRVERGGIVTGRVRAPDGAAVAGARVFVVHGDVWGGTGWIEQGFVPDEGNSSTLVAKTDAGGAYRVSGVPLGGRYTVVATADGWAGSLPAEGVVVTEDRLQAVVDLSLRRTARLDVVVRDAEDRPVDGATVHEVWFDMRPLTGRLVPQGTEPGRHRLEGLTPGSVLIEIHADGFAPVSLSVELAEAEPKEEVIRLARSVSIRGVVLDDRGLPVPGIWVSGHSLSTEIFKFTEQRRHPVTDADGAFELNGLTPGRYRLSANGGRYFADEASPAVEVAAPGDGAVIRVVRLGAVKFRLRLPPGATAPGTVPYSAAGSGAFNWRDGNFVLEYLRPGAGTVRVFPRGFASVTLAYRIAPGETADLGEIVLDEGVMLRGRVVDRAGQPVVGAVVQLVQSQSVGDPSAKTREDGGFALPHASRAENELAVRREGFLFERVSVRGDGGGDAGGASADGLTITLSRGGVLRAQVVDAQGRPVASGYVQVSATGVQSGADANQHNANLDFRGRAELRLPAGHYAVIDVGHATAEIDIVEGTDADVLLTRQ